ncbi:MAG: BON domain-containing protein [Planctomycetes bacterium]|nr:BON domain-containing protein [Planctomycetota bacterium]
MLPHRANRRPDHFAACESRLLTRVQSRLRSSSYYPLRNLECEVRRDVVVLRGRLPSFYLKQVAQELVGSVRGVAEVENAVHVQWLDAE